MKKPLSQKLLLTTCTLLLCSFVLPTASAANCDGLSTKTSTIETGSGTSITTSPYQMCMDQNTFNTTKDTFVSRIDNAQAVKACQLMKQDSSVYTQDPSYIDKCASGVVGGLAGLRNIYTIIQSSGSTNEFGITGINNIITQDKTYTSVADKLGLEVANYTFAEKAAELEKTKFKVSVLPGFAGNLPSLFNRIIQVIAFTSGSLAIFLWVYESFLVIQGADPAIQRYRKKLVNIAIGLIVIFGAFLLVSAVMTIIYNL